jgi:hypothetical protein
MRVSFAIGASKGIRCVIIVLIMSASNLALTPHQQPTTQFQTVRESIISNTNGEASDPVLRIKFEVNGMRVDDRGFKVVIYASEKLLVPNTIRGGFVVPLEIYDFPSVSIRFTLRGQDLLFERVETFDFRADDWTVGIWNKPPFDPEIILSAPQGGKQLKAIRYIRTNPKDGFGVILADQTYEGGAVSKTQRSPLGSRHNQPTGPWLNLPNSPLQIERSPNGRFITLSNYSSTGTIGYRLGCVRGNNSGIKAIRQFKETAMLLPGAERGSNLFSFTIVNLNDADVRKCNENAARLAVTEVVFVDKSRWQIDRERNAPLSRSTLFRPWRLIR